MQENVKEKLKRYAGILRNSTVKERKFKAFTLVMICTMILFFILYFDDGMSDKSIKALKITLDSIMWFFAIFCSGNVVEDIGIKKFGAKK